MLKGMNIGQLRLGSLFLVLGLVACQDQDQPTLTTQAWPTNTILYSIDGLTDSATQLAGATLPMGVKSIAVLVGSPAANKYGNVIWKIDGAYLTTSTAAPYFDIGGKIGPKRSVLMDLGFLQPGQHTFSADFWQGAYPTGTKVGNASASFSIPTDNRAASRLLMGVVAVQNDDGSFGNMNGFGYNPAKPPTTLAERPPVALHVTNFGGGEIVGTGIAPAGTPPSQVNGNLYGWTFLENRIQSVIDANAQPVIHAATVPKIFSAAGGVEYGINNKWRDSTAVSDYATALGKIMQRKGLKYVVFGNEGKDVNYFWNGYQAGAADTSVATYIANFRVFAKALRLQAPGVKVFAPYTTNIDVQSANGVVTTDGTYPMGIPIVEAQPYKKQFEVWGEVINRLYIDSTTPSNEKMDGLAWDISVEKAEYYMQYWAAFNNWLENKNPGGTLKIWLTEWYPLPETKKVTDAAQAAWQIARIATYPRYEMVNMWGGNGVGQSGPKLWTTGGAKNQPMYDTVSKSVGFVQCRPVVATSAYVFKNSCNQTLTVNPNNTTTPITIQ